MIQILVVEDNSAKLENIKKTILDNSTIKESDLAIARNIKEAKKFLYSKCYDLMVLDLVLPIENNDDASAENGLVFLEDIHTSPMIKPPIQIIGLSGFSDLVDQHDEKFKKHLWYLIDYRADSNSWQEQLKSVLFHLVKIRQLFISESVAKSLYDVAIITALPEPELAAVLKLGNKSWEKVEVQNDSTVYYKTEFNENGKVKTIIAASADQMGMTASSYLATKMILYFKPKYIFMAGICAGVKDRELGYGDIIIAEQSWDYGSGKMVEKKSSEDAHGLSDIIFELDLRPIQLDSELKAKIASFQMSHGSLIDRIQNDWPGNTPRTKLQSKLGPLASGSYVISSEETLGEIRLQQRKLLGIEMETYGVYYAAAHGPKPQTMAISIKSVADYGDGSKNDLYQKYAAYTSANYIYYFIVNEL